MTHRNIITEGMGDGSDTGDEVSVLHVPKANLALGDGVREPSVYPEAEAMLRKPLAEHALA